MSVLFYLVSSFILLVIISFLYLVLTREEALRKDAWVSRIDRFPKWNDNE